jgi:four helix bundle protein
MQLGSPEKLIVWKKSIDLVVHVYKFTDQFPKSEQYGLISQMRRSAISIPSNIAEGRRRGSANEFRHFIRIAFGSAAELETQIVISRRLGFGEAALHQGIQSLLNEILRMLNVLSR